MGPLAHAFDISLGVLQVRCQIYIYLFYHIRASPTGISFLHMSFSKIKAYVAKKALELAVSADMDYDHLNPTEMAHSFISNLLLSPLSNWPEPKLCRYRTIRHRES